MLIQQPLLQGNIDAYGCMLNAFIGDYLATGHHSALAWEIFHYTWPFIAITAPVGHTLQMADNALCIGTHNIKINHVVLS